MKFSTHTLVSSQLLKPSLGQLRRYLRVLNNGSANGLSLLTLGLLYEVTAPSSYAIHYDIGDAGKLAA